MLRARRQFELNADALYGPAMIGSFVVSACHKNTYRINSFLKWLTRYSGNRDGPLIFHMRDGPPNVTGPPGGTGPPLCCETLIISGTGPPQTNDPPKEWWVRKKTLKHS